MKIEIEITDEMEDAIILESLTTHFGYQTSDVPTYEKDSKKHKELVRAFKIILDYYGGS